MRGRIAVGALAVVIGGALLWSRHRPATPPPERRSARPARTPHRPLPHQPTAAAALRAAAEPAGDLALLGVVLDEDGAPAPGAVVGVDGLAPIETRTDRAGEFRLPGLLARPYRIEARRDDGYAGPLTVFPEANPNPIALRLRPGATLAVTVRDRAGVAVAGAEVELLGAAPLIAATGTDGQARLAGVGPGAQRLRASAPGFATTWVDLSVEAGQGERTLDVVLEPGAAVVGVVRDATGAAVAGARVAIEQCEDTSRLAEAAVVTDAAGRFALPVLPPATYLLVAGHPEHAPGQAFVELGPDPPASEVELRLGAGVRVRGRVVEASGGPIARALVTATAGAGDNPGYRFVPPVQTWSDGRGEFVLAGLDGAAVTLVAHHELGASAPAEVELGAGATAPVVLSIAGGARIAGTVVDGSGAPVAGAEVLAWPEAHVATGGGRTVDLTGTDGTFELTGLAAGAWTIAARAPGFEPAQVRAEAGAAGVRVALAAVGRVRGRLVFSDGSAPEDFTIGRFGSGGRFRGTAGAFVLDDLFAGPHRLEAVGPDFPATALPEVEALSGREVDLGTIVVARGRTLRGRLIAPDGSPAAGAGLRAGTGLDTFIPRDRVARTDAAGAFVITGLPVTDFELQVAASAGVLPGRGPARGLTVPAGAGDLDLGAIHLVDPALPPLADDILQLVPRDAGR